MTPPEPAPVPPRRAPERERIARAGLARLTEPGRPAVAAAVARVGAVALYDDVVARRGAGAGAEDLLGPAGRELADDAAARSGALDPELELERADRLGVRFVVPGDDEWPAGLDGLAHAAPVGGQGGPPLGLWVRGPARLDEVDGGVAVVGSRSSTTYGEDTARAIAAGVVRAGLGVVSGAAFGIDQAAHRGALALDGVTVAVLACGPDRTYPAAHHELIAHIAASGAVVTELPLGCAPLRGRFLARNRIIAGLARGTVVVEAADRSGALNSASWAASLLRPVMGVPGPVTAASSAGVHELLRSGEATLVTGPDDVLEVVGRAGEHLVADRRSPDRPRDRLTARHRDVLDAVPVGRAAGLRSIAATAGIALLDTQTALAHLVRLGQVETDGPGWRLARRPGERPGAS